MILYHVTQSFQRQLDAGELSVINVEQKREYGYMLTLADTDGKRLKLRVVDPALQWLDDVPDGTPAVLGGALLRELELYAYRARFGTFYFDVSSAVFELDVDGRPVRLAIGGSRNG